MPFRDVEELLEDCRTAAVLADERQRVVFLNSAAEELLGVTLDDAEGRPGEEIGRRLEALERHAIPLHDPEGQVIGSVTTYREPEVRSAPSGVAGAAPPSSGWYGMVGAHPTMRAMFEKIRLAAPSDVAVLITGPSGTGKELVARAVHECSRRANRAFVPVNCAAIPESLLEASLFGHVKGAFTGASHDAVGYVGRASGGTLFLDEIGEIRPPLQVKLLRLLQEFSYERVGETKARTADVRLVTATNRDLRSLLSEGDLRDDFYYRIAAFPIEVPPLAERKSDIPVLVDHFLAGLSRRVEDVPPGVEPDVLQAFRRHRWPGNVRELQNVLEYAAIVSCGARISLDDLPTTFHAGAVPFEKSPAELTEDDLRSVLDRVGWNRTRAAGLLGISRVTLWKRLKALGLTGPDGGDGPD